MEMKLKRVTRSSEVQKADKITLRWTGEDADGVTVSLTITGGRMEDLARVCPTRTGAVADLLLRPGYADICSYEQPAPTPSDEEADEEAEAQALENKIQDAEQRNQALGLKTEAQLAQEYRELAEFFKTGQDPRELTEPEALQRRRAAWAAQNQEIAG